MAVAGATAGIGAEVGLTGDAEDAGGVQGGTGRDADEDEDGDGDGEDGSERRTACDAIGWN